MSILQSSKTAAIKAAVTLAISGGGVLLFASTAFAGVGGSAVPDYPSPVTVGQTGLAATLTITNNSTASNMGDSLTVTSITHAPSCGSSSNSTCQAADADTGVFTVHNGTGAAGTACAGTTFTAGAPDSNGNVTFTPGSTVTLGPTSGPLAAKECIIDFTVDVLKVPAKDADSGITGVQTDQLGAVTFHDVTANLNGSASGSTETTVLKASPAISTTPSSGGPIGTVLNDTATLTGGSSPTTGSVTFNLYAPSDATCSAAPVYTNTDPTSPYATSPGFTSNAVGTYHWTASYAGDASNNATSSSCSAETAIVTKAAPTITTTLSTTTPVLTGTAVHDSATLSNATSNAGGSATYTVYTDNACTLGAQNAGTVTVNNGSVPDSNPITFNTPGTFYWQVVYSGDANNAPATSTCGSEVLTVQAPPPPPAGQYCSPGYWKQPQHFHSYVTYAPTSLFDTVFSDTAFPSMSLVQVLSQGGGGLNALGRLVVGELLNTSAGLATGTTTSGIISTFNAILSGAPSGNANSYYGGFQGLFTAPENCPLN